MTRGFFAVGIASSKRPINVGTLWRTASLYDAAFVFTVGRRWEGEASDTMNTRRHTPMFHFADVADLVAHLPHGTPLVGVELDPRAVTLADYDHRIRACYLLGAEDHGLTNEQSDACHDLVQIESVRPYSMNVAVAGSLVIYDRFTKVRAAVSA